MKCVLLHNGNTLGSIPIAHSVHAEEGYGEITTVLSLLDYQEHGWVICVGLKIVNFLLGQQGSYTKYPYFLCYWIAALEINTGLRRTGQLEDISK